MTILQQAMDAASDCTKQTGDILRDGDFCKKMNQLHKLNMQRRDMLVKALKLLNEEVDLAELAAKNSMGIVMKLRLSDTGKKIG